MVEANVSLSGQLNLELENVGNRNVLGNVGRISKKGNSPSLVIHCVGTLAQAQYK